MDDLTPDQEMELFEATGLLYAGRVHQHTMRQSCPWRATPCRHVATWTFDVVGDCRSPDQFPVFLEAKGHLYETLRDHFAAHMN